MKREGHQHGMVRVTPLIKTHPKHIHFHHIDPSKAQQNSRKMKGEGHQHGMVRVTPLIKTHPKHIHFHHIDPSKAQQNSRKINGEGRQHGMVRCYPILPWPWNPKPETRYINRFDSPPTGGLFTKVSPKPTNHSKYTGKCNRPRCAGCHIHPARKSKDKAKGTQELYGLCLELAGVSAREILNDLDGGEDDDTDEESFPYDTLAESLMHQNVFLKAKVNEDDDVDAGDDDNDKQKHDDDDDDHDDDKMSFCDVGLVWEDVDGDEGWCLVREM